MQHSRQPQKHSGAGRRVLRKGSPPNLIFFYRRLSVMLGAGIPLLACLESLLRAEEDEEMRQLLDQLCASLQRGNSLSKSMAGAGKFSPLALGFVTLGEATGRLQLAIDRLADLSERDFRLRHAVRAALTYPGAILVVMVVLGSGFLLLLGSGDSALFASTGAELPWATRLLVTIAGWLRNPRILLPALLYLLGLLLACRWMLRRDPRLRKRFHAAVLDLPVLGMAIRKTHVARMLYVLAAAICVGLPVAKALQLARATCNNDFMLDRLDWAMAAFQEHGDLAETMEECEFFPPLVVSMVRLGLETGKLNVVLDRLANNYEDEVDFSLKQAVRLIEPLLLGVAGLAAGFLAIAALQPLFGLSDAF